MNWTRLNDAAERLRLPLQQRLQRKIAPAVATFSESAPADIGIVTR